MISFVHRFHGHGSIRSVYRFGKTIRGPLFSIRYNENKHKNGYRVGVVVSKKVCKGSVKRNRIRRRLFECTRVLLNEEANIDIVITVFSENVATISHPELFRAVKAQLHQAGIPVKNLK